MKLTLRDLFLKWSLHALLVLIGTTDADGSNAVFPYSEQMNVFTDRLMLFAVDHTECVEKARRDIVNKFLGDAKLESVGLYKRARVELRKRSEVRYIKEAGSMRPLSGMFPVLVGEVADALLSHCLFRYLDVGVYSGFSVGRKLPRDLVGDLDRELLGKNTISFLLFKGVWYIYEGRGFYSPVRIGENMQHSGIFSYSGVLYSLHYIFVREEFREKAIIDNLGSHRKKKTETDENMMEKLRQEFIFRRSLLSAVLKEQDERMDMNARQVVILRDKTERDLKMEMARYGKKAQNVQESCDSCRDVFKCPSCNLEIFPSESDIEFNSMAILRSRGLWYEDTVNSDTKFQINSPFYDKMDPEKYNTFCIGISSRESGAGTELNSRRTAYSQHWSTDPLEDDNSLIFGSEESLGAIGSNGQGVNSHAASSSLSVSPDPIKSKATHHSPETTGDYSHSSKEHKPQDQTSKDPDSNSKNERKPLKRLPRFQGMGESTHLEQSLSQSQTSPAPTPPYSAPAPAPAPTPPAPAPAPAPTPPAPAPAPTPPAPAPAPAPPYSAPAPPYSAPAPPYSAPAPPYSAPAPPYSAPAPPYSAPAPPYSAPAPPYSAPAPPAPAPAPAPYPTPLTYTYSYPYPYPYTLAHFPYPPPIPYPALAPQAPQTPAPVSWSNSQDQSLSQSKTAPNSVSQPRNKRQPRPSSSRELARRKSKSRSRGRGSEGGSLPDKRPIYQDHRDGRDRVPRKARRRRQSSGSKSQSSGREDRRGARPVESKYGQGSSAYDDDYDYSRSSGSLSSLDRSVSSSSPGSRDPQNDLDLEIQVPTIRVGWTRQERARLEAIIGAKQEESFAVAYSSFGLRLVRKLVDFEPFWSNRKHKLINMGGINIHIDFYHQDGQEEKHTKQV